MNEVKFMRFSMKQRTGMLSAVNALRRVVQFVGFISVFSAILIGQADANALDEVKGWFGRFFHADEALPPHSAVLAPLSKKALVSKVNAGAVRWCDELLSNLQANGEIDLATLQCAGRNDSKFRKIFSEKPSMETCEDLGMARYATSLDRYQSENLIIYYLGGVDWLCGLDDYGWSYVVVQRNSGTLVGDVSGFTQAEFVENPVKKVTIKTKTTVVDIYGNPDYWVNSSFDLVDTALSLQWRNVIVKEFGPTWEKLHPKLAAARHRKEREERQRLERERTERLTRQLESLTREITAVGRTQSYSIEEKKEKMEIIQQNYGEEMFATAIRLVPIYDKKTKTFKSLDNYSRDMVRNNSTSGSNTPFERDPVGSSMSLFFDTSAENVRYQLGLK